MASSSGDSISTLSYTAGVRANRRQCRQRWIVTVGWFPGPDCRIDDRSTLDARQAPHWFAAFGTIRVPHRQHGICITDDDGCREDAGWSEALLFVWRLVILAGARGGSERPLSEILLQSTAFLRREKAGSDGEKLRDA
jgi:hypothetical protein